MLKKLKDNITLNAKHLVGWHTDRKIIVFSVDDYGNVRLNSKQARDTLDAHNIYVNIPFAGFDLYDALETKEDLEMLFEVLSSVKDKNGNGAVFTAFAVPCNPNFEQIIASDFEEYSCELLPETFEKLSQSQPQAYEGAWELWQQGMRNHLLIPQFHGREHFNLAAFENMLVEKNPDFLTMLNTRSVARMPADPQATRPMSAAFAFWDFEENDRFEYIIKDGLKAFESVFGFRAMHFMAPGRCEHTIIHKSLKDNGIQYIDTPMIKKEHQGNGNYKRSFNYTGKKNELGQTFIVRNVLFEPTDNRTGNWVEWALNQIDAAFRWNRPAIISSHRVNFCGHIDSKNREKGLGALQELLRNITERWPEVEFMAAHELGQLVD